MNEKAENNGQEEEILELDFNDFEVIEENEGLTERELSVKVFKDLVGEEVANVIDFEKVSDEQLEQLLTIARDQNSTNKNVRDLIGKIHNLLGKENMKTGLEEMIFKEEDSKVMSEIFPTTRKAVENLERENPGDPRLDVLLRKKIVPETENSEMGDVEDGITQEQYASLMEGLDDQVVVTNPNN